MSMTMLTMTLSFKFSGEKCCPAGCCPVLGPGLRKVCCLPSTRQNKIKENRCNSILSNTGQCSSVQGEVRGAGNSDNHSILSDLFFVTNSYPKRY